ncbi:MAG: multidrug efflux SMR transporter [Nitrospinae bacterium]|nr:multidrug efflux SMR transporter [Nitrospinota bacterium]
MSYIYLILAIVLEVSGTTCMKLSEGFSKIFPSLLIFIFYGFSLGSLNLALKSIDVSIAYAVWSAVGTALIATIGILWFRESVSVLKVFSLCLVIVGVIGLHLSGGTH